MSSSCVLDYLLFSVGDLVTTVLGDYGIILKYGKHAKYPTDGVEYYHVLIKNEIHCYLPYALIKIENSIDK